MSLRNLTIARAAREAVMWEMENDPDVFMIGQDLYNFGGVFGAAEGLGERFGAERIVDTPISETGVIGLATGAAMEGMRPIVEMAYADFIGVCLNALVNYAAKTHYMSGGQYKVPMVMQIGTGAGYNNGAQHSQCLHATFAHFPGLKIVYPTNSHDAKGLMHAAIRDDNPVIFLTHKMTAGVFWLGNYIRSAVWEVPEEPYVTPLGKARIYREGTDITLVAAGRCLHESLLVAQELEARGVSAEVIDPRTLVPLDREAIIASVRKTGRLVVADEDYLSYGVTGEIVASVAEEDPAMFKAPPRRVAFPDVPIPYADSLEDPLLPYRDRIAAAVEQVLG